MTQANNDSNQDPEERRGPRSLWIVLAVLLILAAFQLPQWFGPGAKTLDLPVTKIYVTATLQPKTVVVVTLTAGRKTEMAAGATTMVERTQTVTPSATQTPTRHITSIPMSTADPLPGGQSAGQVYRLKEWSQTEMLTVLNEARQLQPYGNWDEIGTRFYAESILHEAFLRFPELRNMANLTDWMVNLKSGYWPPVEGYGLVHDLSIEAFRSQLENKLNDSSLDPGQLESWGTGQHYAFELPFLESVAITTADHLFDDQSKATVLQVTNGLYGSFFIIRKAVSDRYRIYSLYPQWRMFSRSVEGFTIRDLNGDGQEELVVQYDGWGMGFSHFCDRKLNIYSWDGKAFTDLAADPISEFANTDEGDCLDIRYSLQVDGSQEITAAVQLKTVCEDTFYTEETIHRWDGRVFRKIQERSQPLQDATLSRCSIDWADKAAPENDQAVSILTAAIQQWPADAIAEWGPASQDYFTLVLGTRYLRRGEIDAGIQQFRAVRDHPAAPQYALAGQIAQTFLEKLESNGLYQAVSSAGDLFDQEADRIRFKDVSIRQVDALKEWGFARLEWEYELRFTNFLWSVPRLTLAINQADPKTLHEFENVLIRNQFQYSDLQQSDFDGDGVDDWVLKHARRNEKYKNTIEDLYVFLRKPDRIVVVDITWTLTSDGENKTPFGWVPFQPASNVRRNVIWVNGSLSVAHIEKDNDDYVLVWDINLYPYFLSEVGAVINSWAVVNTAQGQVLVVTYDQGRSEFAWDPKEGQLKANGLSPQLQEENIATAERYLFVDHDPARSNQLLGELLAEKTWEEFPRNGCYTDVCPPILRPYLLYLRGLASEMEGDEDQAVQAYYDLWSQYPDNPYTLIARRRLDRVQ